MTSGEFLQNTNESELRIGPDNAVVRTILDRRAVRTGFLDEEITPEIVETIVTCGLNAPSSKNAQPWKLHVVTKREILKDVARDVLQAKTGQKYVPHDPATGEPRDDFDDTVDESAHVLGNVPLGIFVEDRGIFSINRETVADTEFNKTSAVFGFGLEYIGLGACIENMWLAAEAQGLRAVFMGDAAIAEDKIRNRFEMQGDFIGVLAVGYTIDNPHHKTIEDDLDRWY